MNDFNRDELIEISEYCNAWESGVGMSDFRMNLWHKIESMIDNYCEHDYRSTGNHPWLHCIKCRNNFNFVETKIC